MVTNQHIAWKVTAKEGAQPGGEALWQMRHDASSGHPLVVQAEAAGCPYLLTSFGWIYLSKGSLDLYHECFISAVEAHIQYSPNLREV
jgi:hypothetical protein